MVVTEENTLKLISSVLYKITEFVYSDNEANEDYKEYVKLSSEDADSDNSDQNHLMSYIFEDLMVTKAISLFDFYLEKHPETINEEKEVVLSLKNSISSIFEIKRVLKDGFELYNLINEKDYKALAIIKMINFRGISQGEYLIGTIFQIK